MSVALPSRGFATESESSPVPCEPKQASGPNGRSVSSVEQQNAAKIALQFV